MTLTLDDNAQTSISSEIEFIVDECEIESFQLDFDLS